MSRNWTKREIERCVDLTLDGINIHEIAKRLRAASDTVRALQIEVGLIDASSLRRRWTEADLAKARERYADMSTAELARELGRPLCSVYHMAKKLGLKKSEAYLASPAACRLRRGDEVGKRYRFSKGHVPANKGKRVPGYAPGRMATTQFRKGESKNKMPLAEDLKEVIRLNASLKRRIRRIDREKQDDGSTQPPFRNAGGSERPREAHGC